MNAIYFKKQLEQFMKATMIFLIILLAYTTSSMANIDVDPEPQLDIATILGSKVNKANNRERPSNYSPKTLKGGSDIGGGDRSAPVLSWCDESTTILLDIRAEASELDSYAGDTFGAIKLLYEGMIKALEQGTTSRGVNSENSITFRAIKRGVQLAQIMNIPKLIYSNSRHINKKELNNMFNFLDGYYVFVEKISRSFDFPHYIYYFSQVNSSDINKRAVIKMSDLEAEFLDYAIEQFASFGRKFIHLKQDRSGYYPTITVPKVFAGIRYLAHELEADLQDSIFGGDIFSCQIQDLRNLQSLISRYLRSRRGWQMDPVKLNMVKLRMNKIIEQIELKTCHL